MHRDPARFPLHARLAAMEAEAKAALSYNRWLHDTGHHICTADTGGYRWAGLDAERSVLMWLGIDLEAFEQEQRVIAAEQAEDDARQELAAAAAPLVPCGQDG